MVGVRSALVPVPPAVTVTVSQSSLASLAAVLSPVASPAGPRKGVTQRPSLFVRRQIVARELADSRLTVLLSLLSVPFSFSLRRQRQTCD